MSTPINVLKIKDENNNWTSVPAIKGASVYFITPPTTFTSPTEPTRTGWKWTFYDEAANTSHFVQVYNGAAGSEITVDDIGISGGTNINLYAVRYGDVQTLSSEQKALARANISAMELFSAGETGQIIQSNGTTWQAATVNFVPNISAEVSSYVLTAISGQEYGWSTIPVISSQTIQDIVSGSSSVLITKTIQTNGLYNPQDEGAYGYSFVTAAIPSGFGVTSASNSTGNTAIITGTVV